MDCQELQAQIQDKTAECYDLEQQHNQCEMELTDLWMLYFYYCQGA